MGGNLQHSRHIRYVAVRVSQNNFMVVNRSSQLNNARFIIELGTYWWS